MPEQVRRIVRDFELLDFTHYSFTMLDAPLLTAFVERWHKETSSFYLPFGEMNITLDDVSSLFHLPIGSRFWTTPVLSQSLTCITTARDLGVFEGVVHKEFTFNRGVHLRIFWLRKTYNEVVAVGSYEVAARMYMLYLIACNLFADRSSFYIDTLHVCLFSSLEVTNWAWGCIVLTIMYTTLGVMTIF